MIETQTITFIGAGNMARSLIGGLIANGYNPQKIWATAPNADKLSALQNEFQIRTSTDNHEGVEQAQMIVLAVKPQMIKAVALDLHELISKHKPLVISVAGGTGLNHLSQWFGDNIAIVRCMPNIAAFVRSSATVLCANANVTRTQKDQAESLMRAVGITAWLDQEAQIDIVAALSGSGPAYFFLMMEVLEQAAVQHGLPQEIAHLLTLQTAFGATKMALESDETLNALRRQVTSPGGTTEQALKILEQGGIAQLFEQALKAAHARALELSALHGGAEK